MNKNAFAVGDTAYIIANGNSDAATLMRSGEKVTITKPYAPHKVRKCELCGTFGVTLSDGTRQYASLHILAKEPTDKPEQKCTTEQIHKFVKVRRRR